MKPAPMLSPGDVVFFKTCSRDHGRKAKQIAFKGGTGFAIMLGIVPVNGQPPLEEHLMRLMGSTGYMAFDDIAKFLGDDMGKKCVQMFEEKYYKTAEVKDAVKESMNGKHPKIMPVPKPKLILPESET